MYLPHLLLELSLRPFRTYAVFACLSGRNKVIQKRDCRGDITLSGICSDADKLYRDDLHLVIVYQRFLVSIYSFTSS